MSIDISSVIPVIHPIDISVNKDEDFQLVNAVEGASESGGSQLHLNRDGFTEIIRDNPAGVGETYTTKGELIKEYGSHSKNGNITIDMRI
jgi:hypothetical protein